MGEQPEETTKRSAQASPKVGFSNDGTLVVKNRAYRRRWKTLAELEGKSKNYYTKKKTHKRKRNGKTATIRKKTRK